LRPADGVASRHLNGLFGCSLRAGRSARRPHQHDRQIHRTTIGGEAIFPARRPLRPLRGGSAVVDRQPISACHRYRNLDGDGGARAYFIGCRLHGARSDQDEARRAPSPRDTGLRADRPGSTGGAKHEMRFHRPGKYVGKRKRFLAITSGSEASFLCRGPSQALWI